MKKILMATTIVASSVIAVSAANATVFNRSASVKIVTPLSLTSTSDLNFATIAKPASGSVDVTVSPTGTVTDSTNAIVAGTPTAGVYSLIGDATNQVSIAVAADAGSAVSGLTLGTFTLDYNSASYTSGFTTAPGAGKPLKIGATLNVDSTVATGTLTPGYNITVTYQ
jgi:hypothetical protein